MQGTTDWLFLKNIQLLVDNEWFIQLLVDNELSIQLLVDNEWSCWCTVTAVI